MHDDDGIDILDRLLSCYLSFCLLKTKKKSFRCPRRRTPDLFILELTLLSKRMKIVRCWFGLRTQTRNACLRNVRTKTFTSIVFYIWKLPNDIRVLLNTVHTVKLFTPDNYRTSIRENPIFLRYRPGIFR